MKLLIILSLIAAFLTSSWALKNRMFSFFFYFLIYFISLFKWNYFLEICGLPHSRNGDGRISCEAYIPSWTYDSANGECVKFIYGGCGGNDNRFDSKENCEKRCLE
ncbi:hypothetical protein KR054_012638 [Drosophila jambulina]|nr:hypothetical protein KR054_012638 [Drosophila jambulina]